MQTQPAAKRRTPSKPRPRALPELLPAEHRLFWVSAWQRDVLMREAMHRFVARPALSRESRTLQEALWTGIGGIEKQAAESLKNLREEGLILFAWVPEGGAA